MSEKLCEICDKPMEKVGKTGVYICHNDKTVSELEKECTHKSFFDEVERMHSYIAKNKAELEYSEKKQLAYDFMCSYRCLIEHNQSKCYDKHNINNVLDIVLYVLAVAVKECIENDLMKGQ